MDPLVSTEWLANEQPAGDLRILDASYHLDAGRNAAAEFAVGHIPGAGFLDLGNLVDASASTENTAPPPEQFASRMQALGVGDGSRIVVYDDSAIKSAARAWFLLRMFGAHNVAILDGGLAKWRAEGRSLEAGHTVRRERHFTAWQDAGQLRSKAQMLANLSPPREQVIDARSAARFSGEAPEARAQLASGHIPGSLNIHYAQLFNPDGTFKDRAELRALFLAQGVSLDTPTITTCGSGITACIVSFALFLLGKRDVALYDGSWSEWGADPAMPKQRGAAVTA